ncbi:MAG: Radical SAM protein [Candidatus Nitrospira kreftii]|uniref:Radical SAM protein n=1 Tax=Candidatus Nitrospira kreftii TaxID=2652173 RepID=A0A7S8FDQ6_9BACT|nr:MAG: Radical SAM protein [Candidatus Nitrospira kreftii]
MRSPRVLLLIPPLTQLNTPYPSTAYLTGFLETHGIRAEQADLGIEMVLRLFSPDGLSHVFSQLQSSSNTLPKEAITMMKAEHSYIQMIEPVVSFLQGRTPDAATRLIEPGVLPQGPRFRGRKTFPRSVSVDDQAKQWATFFLEDLADLVQATITPHFSMSRYAEHIGRSASSFDQIANALTASPSLTDQWLLESFWTHFERVKPSLVGLSVPFPGNLYGAFRIARAIKQRYPAVPVALGGGYVNTELRRVSDPRVFDYVDFITLDNGERPLLSLVEHLSGLRSLQSLCRTMYREKHRVVYTDDSSSTDFTMNETGCPTYRGLALDQYLTILDSINPMHRLWSEGHWNKLTVAHGCYWKQCTFCDVGLNYISRYEMTPTDRLIQQIEQLVAETGRTRFHFVDEAAPPAALKSLALALLERKLKITWWGNIRFETTFSPDLCRLLSASGCIAVTAGLEAASDRLLGNMKKGITVDQTALVAAGFKEAGILIHAYLMFGCPSETIQETVDSLERVRQLVAADLIQSAFWHRFTVTAHSPIGLNPDAHGLRILGPDFQGFAENDLLHDDRCGRTPDWLGEGLRRSLLNYLERRGLDLDIRQWFDEDVPRPTVPSTWLKQLLKNRVIEERRGGERRCVWLGGTVTCEPEGSRFRLIYDGSGKEYILNLPESQAKWVQQLIVTSTPRSSSQEYPYIHQVGSQFPGTISDFNAFLNTSSWKKIRSIGLVLV